MKRLLLPLFVAISMLALTSCDGSKFSKKHAREDILKELEELKSELPQETYGFTCVDAKLEGDWIVFEYTCSQEDYDETMLTQIAKNDRGLALFLTEFEEDGMDDLEHYIKNGFGIKYIFTEETSEKTILEVPMSAEKLKDITSRIKSGKLRPYTQLDIFKLEINEMQFPMPAEDGVTMTNAYVKGNSVFYILTIDTYTSSISKSDIADMKQEMAEGLSEEMEYIKDDIIKENIHFVFIYYNARGKKLAAIDIAPSDIF